MKILILASILLVSFSSWAVTIEIKDPCKNKSLLNQTVSTDLAKKLSIGHLTIQLLNEQNIVYKGSEAGLASIYNTPQSDASVTIVSADELLAYGWCYHFNDKEPGEMPDQVYPGSNSDHVVWFFAYSHYFRGEWISMCTPSYDRPLKSYCDLQQIIP